MNAALDDHLPSSARRRVALATWGLFAALALVLGSGGLSSTLLGARAEERGLPTAVSAALTAAYYLGFLLGTRLALRALTLVGHIRAFAALSSILGAAVVFTGISSSPVAWMLLRVVTGLCFAGMYVVAESWLNGLADNSFRGRLLALYSVVVIGSFGIGQSSVFAFDAASPTGFAIAGAIASLAVVPVALSVQASAPASSTPAGMSLRELARVVPTGAGAMLLVGFAHGSTMGLAVTHATREGLSLARTGVLVAGLGIGGMISNWPVNAASDDIDRRIVGVIIALGTMGMAGLFASVDIAGPWAIPAMLGIGMTSSPLYAICCAYTNDWIDADQLEAAASQLVLLYGIGALVGPFIASAFMDTLDSNGYPVAVMALHGAIAVFLVYRIRAWDAPLTRRPWSEVSVPARAFFVPATIVSVGLRRRGRPSPQTDE
ncbi:MAG: MFS transporter [Ilumatobacteraceae bacterium]